jgi:hypothetical protein
VKRIRGVLSGALLDPELVIILSGILQEISFIFLSTLQLKVVSFLKYGKDLF